MKNQVTINLPEGTDKNDIFEIIAEANGYTPTTTETKICEKKVTRKEAEKLALHHQELGTFVGVDTVSDDEFLVKFIELETTDNPVSAGDFGKTYLLEVILSEYKKALITIETKQEKEMIEMKKLAILSQSISITAE